MKRSKKVIGLKQKKHENLVTSAYFSSKKTIDIHSIGYENLIDLAFNQLTVR